MTELKPCPFCGGENVETSYKDTFSGDFRRGVYCADCCGGIYPYYDTEAEAISAWNTRYERTCRLYELDALTQTLSMVNGCAWSKCSVCGCLTPDDSKYCIECGAKVLRNTPKYSETDAVVDE